MEVEQQLRNETEKWLKKVKKERKNIVSNDNKGDEFLKNIDAYISDCEHFLRENKLILAFEAVIWAWSWMSIGKELGIFRMGRDS